MPPSINSGYGRGALHLVEADIENSIPVHGYPVDRPISLGELTLDTGLTVPAAGANIVGRGAIETSLNGLIWDDAADGSDLVRWDWTTPGNFRRLDAAAGYGPLKLYVKARKLDTTGSADDNPDLALVAKLFWHYCDPSGAVEPGPVMSLTTPATALLGDPAAAGDVGAFRWYELDLGARLAAEKKALYEYSTLQLLLGPNETVGTNLAIEVLDLRLRYRAHACFRNFQDRQF